MPRLLPRLLQRLQNVRSRQEQTVSALKRPQCGPPAPITYRPPPECPSLSPDGRTQSIILDSLNPILKLGKYKRHKFVPPSLRVRKRRRKTTSAERLHEYEESRAMTVEERSYWASPYLRMLSSPLRQCLLTKRMLPAEFLIRLSPMRVFTARLGKSAQALLADGIEHPSFKPRRAGHGLYLVCRRTALETFAERGSHKRLSNNVFMHSWLDRQISHLLRVRILQELHILAERLQRRPRGSLGTPVLRRLTRAEWKEVKISGILPYENAIAVLIVPPLNKNPITKLRPEPSTSSTPLEDKEQTKHLRPLPPLSEFLATNSDVFGENDVSPPSILPQSKVPLYNGLSMFPSRRQRAALHAFLIRLLNFERQARFGERARSTVALATRNSQNNVSGDQAKSKLAKKLPRPRGDEKGSHAFLLFSDAATLLRADTVPLAIALWRVRMWEDAGWEGSQHTAGGWMVQQ
ncbi:hypothetical protein AcW2_006352 [Taiwanofungus camphoratus]|nr:hypothetical protein AcW2_006352 [Antrodia cinnamomea]